VTTLVSVAVLITSLGAFSGLALAGSGELVPLANPIAPTSTSPGETMTTAIPSASTTPQALAANASSCPSLAACGWADADFNNNMTDTVGGSDGTGPSNLQNVTGNDFPCSHGSGQNDGGWNDCLSSLNNTHTTCQELWYITAGYGGDHHTNTSESTSPDLTNTYDQHFAGEYNDSISSYENENC